MVIKLPSPLELDDLISLPWKLYNPYCHILQCYVLSVSLMNGYRFIWFFFSQGARITKASHFDFEYVLGHKIVFICVATGKPRPKIIWFKDGTELYDHQYLHVSSTFFAHNIYLGFFHSIYVLRSLIRQDYLEKKCR